MFKLRYKAIISICLLAGGFVLSGLSQAYGQNGAPPGAAPTLGQSDWQTLNPGSNQQYQPASQPLGQSEWQNPGGNAPNYNQAPGLNSNPTGNANAMVQPQAGVAMPGVGQNPWQNANAGMNQYQPNNQPLGQSGWQNPAPNAGPGLSPWQQQNTVQTNVNQNPNAPQQNPDYYYGQVNQNQPNQQNPYAFNNGQYQGQANYSAQPNNQWSSNLPPASSIPPQQTQTQNPQGGGLKSALAGIGKAAAQAAGMGMGVAAPLAGAYMMSKAMTPTVPTYGMPAAMPYGYGYPGMAMPTMYAAPNYGMMNMAPMYASAFSGLSSFMTH